MVPKVTYVLELSEKKRYVGTTYNFNNRFAQHIQGQGARWTRIHKPTGNVLSIEIGDFERERTLHHMREIGWENVRGGPWCKIDMANPPKELKR